MATAVKVFRPDSDIKAVIVHITPELAEQWLAKVKNNRVLSNPTIAKYARLMKLGHWHLDGDTIKWDTLGNCIDGQHRLWACTEAKVAFDCLVVYGVSPDAFDTIDSGRHRSAGDIFGIRKIPGGRKTAAVATLVWRYQQQHLQNARPIYPGTPESIEAYEGNREMLLSMERGNAAKHLVSAVVASFCHWLFSSKSETQADLFFERLSTGTNLTSGSPILALREKLQDNRAAAAKLPARSLIILFIRAWNFYRDGKPIKKGGLVVRSGHAHTAEKEFPKVR